MQNLFYLLCAVLFTACTSSNSTKDTPMDTTTVSATNSATTRETADDWISLFDGKTTNGWHTYGKQTIGKAWKVEDSALHLDAASKKDGQAEGGDILTADEFDNFHLKLEWKIAPKGNSGIIFYIKEDAAKYTYPWHTGLEMQVLDNAGHADAKIIKHRAGDLYDLISCSKETVKKAGEWNAIEIIANEGKLQFFLNAEEVINTTMWDDNWKKMIAGSKFKSMSDFGTYKSGRIGLQDHGDDVWYRNIMIRKL